MRTDGDMNETAVDWGVIVVFFRELCLLTLIQLELQPSFDSVAEKILSVKYNTMALIRSALFILSDGK